MQREVSPTPSLYNLAKLCKLAGYLECKRSKWDYEKRGGCSYFQFELLGLMETKLKGNGEVSCCGVNGIIASDKKVERLGKVRSF